MEAYYHSTCRHFVRETTHGTFSPHRVSSIHLVWCIYLRTVISKLPKCCKYTMHWASGIGIILISHYKDPVINQPGFHSSCQGFFNATSWDETGLLGIDAWQRGKPRVLRVGRWFCGWFWAQSHVPLALQHPPVIPNVRRSLDPLRPNRKGGVNVCPNI